MVQYLPFKSWNLLKHTHCLWVLWLCLGLSINTAPAQNTPFAVRVTPTGPLSVCPGSSQTLTATAVYPAFNVGTGFNGSVRAMVIQPDGKVLVGGFFTSYNGNPHNYVIRLNTDGTLDTSFALTGTGLSGSANLFGVFALALQPDGKVLVGGDFSNYNGFVSNGVVRLNTDGTLDTTFNSGTALFGSVITLALQPNGKVLVGGTFANRIARLNADGTLDTTFTVGTGLTGGGSTVFTLVLQPDGKVLVGGTFTSYNSVTRNHIVRLNTDGTLDTTFAPTGTGLSNGALAITIQTDGKVLVGGNFSSYNGIARGSVVRLNTDGTLDTTFNSGTGLNNTTYTLALQPNGKILVGGDFSSYNSVTRNRIVRLNTDGTLDTTFAPTGTGLNGAVLTIAVQTDGKMLVGGEINRYNGVARNRMARLNDNGSLNNADTTIIGASYSWQRGTATVAATASVAANIAGTYTATATLASRSAFSPAVTVALAPVPTVTTAAPTTAASGSTITLAGTNLGSVRRVYFTNEVAGRRCTGTFVVLPSGQLQVTVPDSAATGPLTVFTSCGTLVSVPLASFEVLPTIRSFTPQASSAGTTATITITGTGFTPTGTTVRLNNVLITTTFVSTRVLNAVVPAANATTGPLTVTTATGGTATSTSSFVVVNVAAGHIDINTSRTLTDQVYSGGNSEVVVRPGVTLTVNGFLQIGGRLIIQDGATLVTGLSWNNGTTPPPGAGRVVGGGEFVLAAGATLIIRDPNGISSGSGSSGPIQLMSGRSFSPDAIYIYSGATNQVTGNGLPSRVRNLTVNLPAPYMLTLSEATSVSRKLTLAGSGNFRLNGQPFTLLSDASGTALVHNAGTGVVVGSVTVQRYINPTTNNANGLRYYGSPVAGARASALAAPGQTAAVYDYDQSRPATQRDTIPLITYGFSSQPIPVTSQLKKGRGYAAAIPAAVTVNFVGTLNNGDTTLTLANDISNYYAGWHLVSNPYPSPLDWRLVAPTDRANLEAAIYFYESTGPGQGYYRSYVNGAGTASPLIAAGQAFFVRVKRGQATGTLTFRNSQRITEYNPQVPFNRPSLALDELELVCSKGSGGGSGCGRNGCRALATTTTAEAKVSYSRVTFYRDPTVPASQTWFNPDKDAQADNLQARSNVGLSITNGQDEALSVKHYPAFTATTVIPLTLNASAPDPEYYLGLNSAKLRLADPTLTPYLHDLTANKWKSLRDSVYIFPLTAAEVLNPIVGRFELRFRKVLSVGPAAPWSAAGSVEVYPNPAHHQVQVRVPAVAGTQQVHATLLTSLGQVVRRQEAVLPAAGTTLHLDLKNLAAGVYILRLQAGAATATRRVMVE